MTDRVEEIRERVEKATPGPWEAGDQYIRTQESFGQRGHLLIAKMGNLLNNGIAADAAFIANAPSDIRFLLSKIARLNAAVLLLGNQLQGSAYDTKDLLSEIQRLRVVEAALIRVRSQLGGLVSDPYFGPMARAMVGEVDTVLPEPVREEMER